MMILKKLLKSITKVKKDITKAMMGFYRLKAQHLI